MSTPPTRANSTMPQPWYGQPGHAATAPNRPQPPSNAMHHPRFHHANPPAPLIAPGSAPSYPRASPPVGRPPSSASTSSASSYHTANAPAPGTVRNHYQPSHQIQMNAGPHPSAPNQGHSHHLGRHHGSIRTMGAGRYPMSSRSVVVHSLRPIPRDPLPARQYNAVPHLTAASVSHP